MREETAPQTGTLKPTGKETAQPKAPELPLLGRSTSPIVRKRVDWEETTYVDMNGQRSKNPDRRRMDAHLLGGNREQRRDYIRRSKRLFRLAYGFGVRHNRRVSAAQTARNRSLSPLQAGMGQVPSGTESKG